MSQEKVRPIPDSPEEPLAPLVDMAGCLNLVTWPPERTVPGKRGFEYYFGFAIDAAYIAAALPFLALAGVAAQLAGREAPADQWLLIRDAMTVVCFLSCQRNARG